MPRNIYAIGLGSANRTHFQSLRETNKVRARKTLLQMLRGNTKKTYGRIYRVTTNSAGEEIGLIPIYETRIVRKKGITYRELIFSNI